MVWFVIGLAVWVLVLLLCWVIMDVDLVTRILSLTDSGEGSNNDADRRGPIHSEKQDG